MYFQKRPLVEDLVELWVEVGSKVELEMMKFRIEVVEFLVVLSHFEAYEND